MKNKELIKNTLIKLQQEENEDNYKGVKALDISEILRIHRNVVSMYLNELVKEGLVRKTSTRPVYFKYIADIENSISNDELINTNDPFIKLIGYDNSMSKEVEACKSAVIYPSRGMHIMLLGESGVGKSYLAEIIYEYAKYKKCISENSSFITFNCADYANNPELLSAYLFGYKKGAFTGAEKDTPGLIETANNGYLFLDEVHRLPPEGQEKLFVFFDKGIFRRVGSSEEISNINVKFIFATTENTKKVLLETFSRRIPLSIRIPNLIERPIEERLSLLYHLFYIESKNINIKLNISNRVVNTLLYFDKKGNVGILKNVVKFCCANAYRRCGNNGMVEVAIEDLPVQYLGDNTFKNNFFSEEFMYVSNEIINKYNFISSQKNKEDIFLQCIDNVYKIIKKQEKSFNNNDDNIKKLVKEANGLIDNCVYNSDIINKEQLENIYISGVDEALKIIQNRYGLRYYGNTSKVLTKLLLTLKCSDSSNVEKNKIDKYKYIHSILKKNYSKVCIISDMLLKLLSTTLDYKISLKAKIIVALYFLAIIEFKNSQINGLIIAHGYSTASSIASLTNRVYEEFIFEAFDMPIEMSPKIIVKEVIDYLKNVDTSKGMIILVDMGSLFNIADEIKKNIDGDIGIVNNITTQIALDVGSRIINNQNIETIMKKVQKENIINIKFIKNSIKKKAIITTCISGLGTAIKLRDLMKICLEGEDIEVIEYEYNNLLVNGVDDEVFKQYDVRLIVSTIDINIEGITSMMLPDMISEEYEEKLGNVLRDMDVKKSVESISVNIIKYFSVENIINQLTILNPNKIINDVEKIIFTLESNLDMRFSSHLKMILYIHISMFIERAVLGQAIISDNDYTSFVKCNKKFIEVLENSFSVIEKQYNFSINITEVNLIYQIISSVMPQLSNN